MNNSFRRSTMQYEIFVQPVVSLSSLSIHTYTHMHIQTPQTPNSAALPMDDLDHTCKCEQGETGPETETTSDTLQTTKEGSSWYIYSSTVPLINQIQPSTRRDL
jgi:hypothetical protein